MIEYDKFRNSLKRLEEQCANYRNTDSLSLDPITREALEESGLPFRVNLFVWDNLSGRFRKRIESDHVALVA